MWARKQETGRPLVDGGLSGYLSIPLETYRPTWVFFLITEVGKSRTDSTDSEIKAYEEGIFGERY